jgi:phenylalanyl-tRNA synthetase alpha chain
MPSAAAMHPVTRTLERITEIFGRLGYRTGRRPGDRGRLAQLRGAEFPAASSGARHARHVLLRPDGRLLRTHTSPVQIRYMLQDRQPPLRIIAPGKVYRSDSDQTHTPMFHQVEGLLVDETSSFADLKGTLPSSCDAFFERDFEMRFRPSYFPFTEPSAEVDIAWHQEDGRRAGWKCSVAAWCIRTCCATVGIDPEALHRLRLWPRRRALRDAALRRR